MSLNEFFEPESIAVVGASNTPGKVGNTVVKNLKETFNGEIFPVNPKHDDINGLKCYSSVKDIKRVPDNVVIAVPAKIANKVVEQCVEIGVPTITMLTSGYEEIGEEGEELQKELEHALKGSETRMIGPNCLGIWVGDSGVDSMFLPGYKMNSPLKGNIALISQSGAVGSAVIDKASSIGVGISKFVSYGNQLDVSETDLLEFLEKDEKTDAVAVYMEGVKNGRKFLEKVKDISKKMPVIVLKSGKTDKGSKAAESHTGSLAGNYKVYRGAFKQAGVVEAECNKELLDYSKTLAKSKKPEGNRVAIVTNGGGFGVLSTDTIEKTELEIAELSEETVKELEKNMKEYGNVSNPLDLIGDAKPQEYRQAMETLVNADEVDMLLCISLVQTEQMDTTFIDVLEDIKNNSDKPVVGSILGGDYSKLHRVYLEKNGVPMFEYPERAVEAFEKLYTYSKWRDERS